jgi:hypothetical protein
MEIMIRGREIRTALLGALLFVVVGSVQGCASDAVVGPEPERAQLNETADDCFEANGVWICK